MAKLIPEPKSGCIFVLLLSKFDTPLIVFAKQAAVVFCVYAVC